MTTTTGTPARPVVGLLFALAGLLGGLSLLSVLLHFTVGGVWIGIIVDAAITLGFLFLFFGKGPGMLSRLFFIIAAVGWAILTINGAGISLGIVFTIGIVLALVGSLISGILAFGGKIFTRGANIFFLLATIFMAVVLLNLLVSFLAGTIAIIVVALYAILLLVAGILITARR
jgi:hypothetical protein